MRSPMMFMTGDPYCRRAELVEGGEGRARVGGLVAERPVELGGVPDRLVDRQPQVGRVDHQVVAAGLDGRRLELGGEQLGQLGQLGGEVPARSRQVLPAPAGGRRERAHVVEPGLGDRGRGQLGVQPDPLLRRRGRPVGVELALLHLVNRRVGVADRGVREQPGRPAGEQVDLLLGGDRERVDLVGGDPGDVAVGGLGGELDPLGVHRGGDLGDLDGVPRRVPRGLRRQVDRGGEPPRAVDDDADREPAVVGVGQRLKLPVGQREPLPAHALDPEVGVVRAKRPRGIKRGVGEVPQRQRRELSINTSVMISHATEPIPSGGTQVKTKSHSTQTSHENGRGSRAITAGAPREGAKRRC